MRSGTIVDLTIPIRRLAGVLSGVVVHANGRPASHAWVQVLADDEDRTLLRQARGNGDGRFLARGLPGGPLLVFACPRLGLIDHGAPSLRLTGPAEGVTIRLPPGWTIRGTVTFPSTGLPVEEGRRVSLFEATESGELGFEVPGVTDDDGAFRFDGVVVPGRYVVVVGDARDRSGADATWEPLTLGEVPDGGGVLDLRVAAPARWAPGGP